VTLPDIMRDRLYALVEGAKFSALKTGGDFPYLSRPDEFTMLLQVHLRSHGCYPLLKEKLEGHRYDDAFSDERKANGHDEVDF